MGLFGKNKEENDLNQTKEIKDLSTEISSPNSIDNQIPNPIGSTNQTNESFVNPFAGNTTAATQPQTENPIPNPIPTANVAHPPIDDLVSTPTTQTPMQTEEPKPAIEPLQPMAQTEQPQTTNPIFQKSEEPNGTSIPNPIPKADAGPSAIEQIENSVKTQVTKEDVQEMVDETVEQVIEERWSKIVEKIEKVAAWKEKQESHINLIKEDIVNMKDAFEKLEKRLVNKIGDYDKNIMDVNSEIKALEKVFQKITPTLVNNVNELSKIAKTFKDDDTRTQVLDE